MPKSYTRLCFQLLLFLQQLFFCYEFSMIHVLLRGGYRPDESCKKKLVVAIVKVWKLLDIITKSSNVHDTAVLDPPLLSSRVPN